MRYAVIDIEDGKEYLQYIVGNRNSAEELAIAGEEAFNVEDSIVIAIKAGCPIRTNGGIPVGDDGTPESAERLAKIAREWQVISEDTR